MLFDKNLIHGNPRILNIYLNNIMYNELLILNMYVRNKYVLYLIYQ